MVIAAIGQLLLARRDRGRSLRRPNELEVHRSRAFAMQY
jgi:hypothetical protein